MAGNSMRAARPAVGRNEGALRRAPTFATIWTHPVSANDVHFDLWSGPFGLRRSAGHMACKRILDVVASLVLLLLLAPLLMLVVIAIWLDSPGPVFFVQTRTGRGNRPFAIYKFRSMHVVPFDGNVVQTTKGDARVTRVGAFLRRTSIDELPQLINVLNGTMSLVGPRPHAISHDCFYACHIPGYGSRFSVRPGLTGLAQVSGYRGEVHTLRCMGDRISADLEYIGRWSLTLDLYVMIRTLALLARDEHAY